MSLSDEVVEFISSKEDSSPLHIRAEVKKNFGVEVSPTAVLQVLNDSRRRKNIQSAQTTASERLDHKVDLTEEIIQAYVDMVKDETLDLRQRLTAMKDLRGWVKLSIDAAGDAKGTSDRPFMISEEWDLGFGPN